ncbi:hypothetical protein AOG23_15765 [Rhizobium acidisoli]|nr:hypothetical protein AOG23_15765 [Rhizobium acidisoli]
MLLDAHSLLIADGKDFVIPVDIIAAMEPNGLIFVEAAAEVISRRRTSRGDRGNSISDEITRLQAVALQAVKEYSKSLECPLYIVDADQRVDFARAMEGLS